jgi:hypothetical protein
MPCHCWSDLSKFQNPSGSLFPVFQGKPYTVLKTRRKSMKNGPEKQPYQGSWKFFLFSLFFSLFSGYSAFASAAVASASPHTGEPAPSPHLRGR